MLNCSSCYWRGNGCNRFGKACQFYTPLDDEHEFELYMRDEKKRREIFRREWEMYASGNDTCFFSVRGESL